MVLQAKCPKCGEKVVVDDETTNARCHFCGLNLSYEEYIELMKERVTNLVTNFQSSPDNDPY
ncbi:MAG TPA: zinc-domain-containing protein [Nitrososphaeraceae archaeon]